MPVLYRIDPTRRMSRFYRLDVQPDLFGAWCVMREWGRIGRAGRLIVEPHNTQGAALAAAERLLSQKSKRGYLQHNKAG